MRENVRASGRWKSGALVLLLIAMIGAMLGCGYFRGQDFARGARLTGGNPEIGRKQLSEHSCVSCHTIPGIPNGTGTIAPSLASWSKQEKIAGVCPNTPENLEAWIRNPGRLKAGTSMPDMNVSLQDSRDIAAYLYSLN